MSNEDQIRDLLTLARDTSITARTRLVEEIADLFSERETVLSQHERTMMIQILEKLIRDFEMSVRHALAERLAEEPKAPTALISILANDEIEVARPVLMRSDVLRDHELIEIVRNRTRQHRLAITLRRDLSESLTEAIAENGEEDVIRSLLCNANARISEATMEYLVDQARQVDSFQEPLVGRRDLSGPLAKRLMGYVSAALRVRILEQYDIGENDLDDALEHIIQDLSTEEEPAVRRPKCEQFMGAAGSKDPVWKLARSISEERKIDAPLIIKVLRRGEIALFEALFGEFSRIHPPRLQHILYEEGGRSLAVVCRALNVEKANFAPIFLLTRKERNGETQPADPRELSRALSFFSDIHVEAARQVLRRWQRTPDYLNAVETIEASYNCRQKNPPKK